MANRLSIVIMQSPKSRPDWQQFEEQLLIQLMGARGLDPVLVRAADQLTAEQTDLLPLRAAQADIVVCAWADPQETGDVLRRLGISPHHLPSGRDRLHLFDLRKATSAEALVAEWTRMLQATQTKVVQIGISGRAASPAQNPPVSQADTGSQRQEIRSGPGPNEEPPAEPSPIEQPGQREAELDRLVNQLNDELL